MMFIKFYNFWSTILVAVQRICSVGWQLVVHLVARSRVCL